MKQLLYLVAAMIGCSCATKSPIGPTEVNAQSPLLYADRFDNLYVLKVDGTVDMYDQKGELIFNYANNSLGNVTHLDVTNPQNILAYIQDFNTVVLLDNTLAELSTINLASLEYPDITAVASSNDGNYWKYDQFNWRLLKVDRAGNELSQSNRLSDYNLAQFTPIYMLERNNQVLIATSTEKLLIFDNFGQYIKAVPMPGISKFSYLDGVVYYMADGKIMEQNLLFLTQESKAIAPTKLLKSVVDMVKTDEKTIFLTKSGEIIF